MLSPETLRPARPAAPPLPPFEALDQTHRQVLQALAQLTALVADLEAHDVDDDARKVAAEISHFFDGAARAHHAAEEELVFPTLLNSGDEALVLHVQRLQQDHGWLEQDWLELSPHLRAIAEGQSGYDLDELRAAVPIFSELYREHIALEETIVYPESRKRHAN